LTLTVSVERERVDDPNDGLRGDNGRSRYLERAGSGACPDDRFRVAGGRDQVHRIPVHTVLAARKPLATGPVLAASAALLARRYVGTPSSLDVAHEAPLPLVLSNTQIMDCS
jgi:hypothetical protein